MLPNRISERPRPPLPPAHVRLPLDNSRGEAPPTSGLPRTSQSTPHASQLPRRRPRDDRLEALLQDSRIRRRLAFSASSPKSHLYRRHAASMSNLELIEYFPVTTSDGFFTLLHLHYLEVVVSGQVSLSSLHNPAWPRAARPSPCRAAERLGSLAGAGARLPTSPPTSARRGVHPAA